MYSSSFNLKYQLIAGKISDMVNDLSPGDKLPSEKKLATQFSCNFLTVRKALALLVEQGLVTRRAGSGTFVSESASGAVVGVSETIDHKRIGLLFYSGSNAYGVKVTDAVAQEAERAGISVRTELVTSFNEEAADKIGLLKSAGCCSVVIPWLPGFSYSDVGRLIMNSPLPVIVPDLIPGCESSCFVERGAFMEGQFKVFEDACNYLHLLGYGNIAFLAPKSNSEFTLQNELEAYAAYVNGQGMDNLSMFAGPAASDIDRAVLSWKKYKGDMAIIAYDDTIAMRLLLSMHKHSLTAPDDFALLGFNDIDAGVTSDPPLTTFRPGYSFIAGCILQHALACGNGSSEQSREVARMHLVVRESCGGLTRLEDDLTDVLERLQLPLGYEVQALPLSPEDVKAG